LLNLEEDREVAENLYIHHFRVETLMAPLL